MTDECQQAYEQTAAKWRVEEVRAIALRLLGAAPHGLTAQTLCRALEDQGIPSDKASLVIRSGLDQGLVRLGANLNILHGSKCHD